MIFWLAVRPSILVAGCVAAVNRFQYYVDRRNRRDLHLRGCGHRSGVRRLPLLRHQDGTELIQNTGNLPVHICHFACSKMLASSVVSSSPRNVHNQQYDTIVPTNIFLLQKSSKTDVLTQVLVFVLAGHPVPPQCALASVSSARCNASRTLTNHAYYFDQSTSRFR